MTRAPLTVLVNTDVPGCVLTRIRDVSPRITLFTEPEFQARPELLSEADVLFTHKIRPRAGGGGPPPALGADLRRGRRMVAHARGSAS